MKIPTITLSCKSRRALGEPPSSNVCRALGEHPPSNSHTKCSQPYPSQTRSKNMPLVRLAATMPSGISGVAKMLIYNMFNLKQKPCILPSYDNNFHMRECLQLWTASYYIRDLSNSTQPTLGRQSVDTPQTQSANFWVQQN